MPQLPIHTPPIPIVSRFVTRNQFIQTSHLCIWYEGKPHGPFRYNQRRAAHFPYVG